MTYGTTYDRYIKNTSSCDCTLVAPHKLDLPDNVWYKQRNTQVSAQAMNSHNKDRDHSQTCLFNSDSNGDCHTTLQLVRVISSVIAIYVSAVL